MVAEKLFRKIIKPEKVESEDQSLKLVDKASNFNLLLYFFGYFETEK